MKTEAEPEGMQLQAKEHRGLRAIGHEKSEEARKDPTQSLSGNPALLTLGLGLLASRMVREPTSAVLVIQVMVLGYGSHKKLIQTL